VSLAPLVNLLLQKRAQQSEVRVLESGCGDGTNFVHLQSVGVGEGIRLEGVDLTPRVVEEGRKRGMDIRLGDGLTLPYEDGTFDVTYCRDVFHHLVDDAARVKFFKEMRRVTKTSGTVVAIEPNAFNPAIFGLGLLVRAERGLWAISERRFLKLLPRASVMRVSPSAAWRMWYHYRSPLYASKTARTLVRAGLRVWEALCRFSPSFFWSYRVYVWSGPLAAQHNADGFKGDGEVEER
jgi:SAM-dependent methyltransferase